MSWYRNIGFQVSEIAQIAEIARRHPRLNYCDRQRNRVNRKAEKEKHRLNCKGRQRKEGGGQSQVLLRWFRGLPSSATFSQSMHHKICHKHAF